MNYADMGPLSVSTSSGAITGNASLHLPSTKYASAENIPEHTAEKRYLLSSEQCVQECTCKMPRGDSLLGYGQYLKPESTSGNSAMEKASQMGRQQLREICPQQYGRPDGISIQDAIHVCNLAAAHLLTMERLRRGSRQKRRVSQSEHGELYILALRTSWDKDAPAARTAIFCRGDTCRHLGKTFSEIQTERCS